MIYAALGVLFFYPALTISGQLTRMIGVAMCLLCCHPTTRKRLAEPGILLIAWFAWACICSFLSDHFALSLFGYFKRWEGLPTWALAISFGWLFWQTSNLNKLYVSCGTILAICLGAMIAYPAIYKSAIYGHLTISAFVTIAAAMLMIKHPLFICSAFPFVYLTQNRSMIVGMVAACAIYAALNWRKINPHRLIEIGIALVFVLILAYPKLSTIDASTIGNGARSHAIKQALDYITLKPLTGYGIDTQSTLLKPMEDPEYREARTFVDSRDNTRVLYNTLDRCHNFFFDMLIQTGLIGLIIWLLIIARMTYRAFCCPNEVNRACLLGLMAWLGFNLFNPSGVPSMFLACTCIMGIEKGNYENSN